MVVILRPLEEPRDSDREAFTRFSMHILGTQRPAVALYPQTGVHDADVLRLHEEPRDDQRSRAVFTYSE